MSEQLSSVRNSRLCGVFGWAIAEDGLLAFVSLRPRRQQDKLFLLRISFDDFSRRAPSYVFVDPETRKESDAAWPPGIRHGSSPPGVCTPGTREFHEHYHQNDHQYPWNPTERSVLLTLAEIHRLTGRAFQ